MRFALSRRPSHFMLLAFALGTALTLVPHGASCTEASDVRGSTLTFGFMEAFLENEPRFPASQIDTVAVTLGFRKEGPAYKYDDDEAVAWVMPFPEKRSVALVLEPRRVASSSDAAMAALIARAAAIAVSDGHVVAMTVRDLRQGVDGRTSDRFEEISYSLLSSSWTRTRLVFSW